MASYQKGYLRVSLLTIPVKMNCANKSDDKMSLNQLHEACGQRIKMPKHCPSCNVDVDASDLVSAYEYAKGQYVTVNPADFRAPGDKTITLTAFVPESSVDPVYLRGDNHYITPDGGAGEKPLALLYQALFDSKQCGIGTVVMLGRKRHVVLRALPGGVLAMFTLHCAGAVREPEQFANNAAGASDAEYRLMSQLVKGMQGKFDHAQCRDDYSDRLAAYVAAKVAGQTPAIEPEQVVEPVVDLMAMLKASLAASAA